MRCIEYDGFETAPGTYLNGKLTLGENTADNGGLRLAYQALMETLKDENPQALDAKVDGYTPAQQFFISYGQIWCSKQTDASMRVSAKVDPHSTGKWRVNGAVQNSDAFGKAFGCTTGQPMMPADACRVWSISCASFSAAAGGASCSSQPVCKPLPLALLKIGSAGTNTLGLLQLVRK